MTIPKSSVLALASRYRRSRRAHVAMFILIGGPQAG
jgi:hypothetical protein